MTEALKPCPVAGCPAKPGAYGGAPLCQQPYGGTQPPDLSGCLLRRAQPTREPVAWMTKEGDRIQSIWVHKADAELQHKEWHEQGHAEFCITPLYTSPPAREQAAGEREAFREWCQINGFLRSKDAWAIWHGAWQRAQINAAQNYGTGLAPDAPGSGLTDATSAVPSHHSSAFGSDIGSRQDNPAPVPPLPADIMAAIDECEESCLNIVDGEIDEEPITEAFAKLRAVVGVV